MIARSSKYTLHEIKSEVKRFAAKINASDDLLPTFGYSENGARPRIVVDERGYHYVVVERGQELSRVTTPELDNLLYHVLKDVTFELAGKYELKHRVENQDSRRLIFKHQIELFCRLSQRWGEVKAQEHERILEQHLSDDHANLRADLAKTLRQEGLAPESAWKMACEQYPLPEKS